VRRGERELLICHTGAGVSAFDNLRTHTEARRCEARLRKLTRLCPLHGGAFDRRDGAPLGSPAQVALRHSPGRISGTATGAAC